MGDFNSSRGLFSVGRSRTKVCSGSAPWSVQSSAQHRSSARWGPVWRPTGCNLSEIIPGQGRGVCREKVLRKSGGKENACMAQYYTLIFHLWWGSACRGGKQARDSREPWPWKFWWRGTSRKVIGHRVMQRLAMANAGGARLRVKTQSKALSPELFHFVVSEGICWHLCALDMKIHCLTVTAVLVPEVHFHTAIQMMDILCLHKFALLIFHGFLGNEKRIYNGPQIFV